VDVLWFFVDQLPSITHCVSPMSLRKMKRLAQHTPKRMLYTVLRLNYLVP